MWHPFSYLDNLLTDEEKIRRSRNVVQQKDTVNSLDRANKQQRTLKENDNRKKHFYSESRKDI